MVCHDHIKFVILVSSIANKMKGKWIGHILRRNCLLKHITEGKIEDRNDGKAR